MWIEWSHITKMITRTDVNSSSTYQSSERKVGLLDFTASVRGGVTVIVGPKGSGKSTLLKLSTLSVLPDDGRITYRDRGDTWIWSRGMVMSPCQTGIRELRDRISYVPNLKHWNVSITVEEYLYNLAQKQKVTPIKMKVAETLTRWGLGGVRKKSICKLPYGILKRFLLAQSYIQEPWIWLLDEPTIGLDDIGKRLLWEEIQNRPTELITLIATSDFDFAEIAQDLMLLESGRCRRLGRKKVITASVNDGTVGTWYQAMQAFSHLR